MLTTWHRPHSPAAAAAIDRYLLPAGQESSKPAAASLLLWAHAGTDRQVLLVTCYLRMMGYVAVSFKCPYLASVDPACS